MSGPCRRLGRRYGAVVMGLTSLFMLLDLFGPQVLAPELAQDLKLTAVSSGVIVNSATVGMAGSGLLVACFAESFDRKLLIAGALLATALPTLLLAAAAGPVEFAVLRMAEGLSMCTGFAVSIAYIAEEWGPDGNAPAVMAGFIAGNAGCSAFGRLLSGTVAEYAGWRSAFLVLGVLNLIGSLFLFIALPKSQNHRPSPLTREALRAIRDHLRDPRLQGAYAVGSLILFSFVGTFTYINFVLAQPPFGLPPTTRGLLYLTFAASIVTTPIAGVAVRRLHYRKPLMIGVTVALAGLLATMFQQLLSVLIGMTLIGAGLFFCQAVTTAFTGHIALRFKSAATALYLVAYYVGGTCGAALVGRVFAVWGWPACATAVAAALILLAATAALRWERGDLLLQRRPMDSARSVSPAGSRHFNQRPNLYRRQSARLFRRPIKPPCPLPSVSLRSDAGRLALGRWTARRRPSQPAAAASVVPPGLLSALHAAATVLPFQRATGTEGRSTFILASRAWSPLGGTGTPRRRAIASKNRTLMPCARRTTLRAASSCGHTRQAIWRWVRVGIGLELVIVGVVMSRHLIGSRTSEAVPHRDLR